MRRTEQGTASNNRAKGTAKPSACQSTLGQGQAYTWWGVATVRKGICCKVYGLWLIQNASPPLHQNIARATNRTANHLVM